MRVYSSYLPTDLRGNYYSFALRESGVSGSEESGCAAPDGDEERKPIVRSKLKKAFLAYGNELLLC